MKGQPCAARSQKLDAAAVALHGPHGESSNLWGAFDRARRNLPPNQIALRLQRTLMCGGSEAVERKSERMDTAYSPRLHEEELSAAAERILFRVVESELERGWWMAGKWLSRSSEEWMNCDWEMEGTVRARTG